MTRLLLLLNLTLCVTIALVLGSRKLARVSAAAAPAPARPALLDSTGCRRCYQDEVDGFARTAMGHSMRLPGKEPDGVVRYAGTTIQMTSTPAGFVQTLSAAGTTQRFPISYVIGSGEHASGYLVDLGNHLFQSPVAYYRSRSGFDLAPGFEGKGDPDFTRPIAEGCVYCHAGSNSYVPGTLNTYGTMPFRHMTIGCDRCHGPVQAHLAKPQSGNIVNPADLPDAARDGVCEQCHLLGVARIVNPGKRLTDYKPGDSLEDTLTIYHNVPPAGTSAQFKVISHSEQLALSVCKRSSGGRLWCGTCHDPHDEPAQPVAYFRERCLSCHAKTLFPASHPALTSDCIGCHMPKRNAADGGHTAFTDHRIERRPEPETAMPVDAPIAAWREPATGLQKRDLGIALIQVGTERQSPKDLIDGYRLLTEVQEQSAGDSELFNSIGDALMLGRVYSEAAAAFERAVELDPGSSSKQTNLARAYLALGETALAQQHLERSLELDPLNLPSVSDLIHLYDQQGDTAKAEQLSRRVAQVMFQPLTADTPAPPQK